MAENLVIKTDSARKKMSKKLSQYAKVEIRKLCQQTKHEICLDDVSDLIHLNDLCLAVLDNTSEHNDIIDMPVKLGPYQLHAPSIGALEWFDEYAVKWFSDDVKLQDCALAYVMHLSNLPEDLWKIADKKSAKKAIKKWMRKVNVSHEELQNILISFLGEGDAEEKTEKASAGKLIAILCREYGHDVQYWLWDAPICMITLFVNEYVSRIEAENDAERRAVSGVNKPAMSDTKLARISKMREFVNELREKWSKKM